MNHHVSFSIVVLDTDQNIRPNIVKAGLCKPQPYMSQPNHINLY